MASDINIKVLLQFLADEARRGISGVSADLKGLGVSAEDAGRKSGTAGATLDQTGAAAKGAATALTGAATAMGGTVNEAANLAAEAGRVAAAIGGARDAVTGLASASGGAAQPIISVTSALRAQQNAMETALTASAGFTASIGDQTEAMMRHSRATASWQAELDGVRAKFNPLFAASKQYEAVLGEISQAEKMGALSAMEAGAARERAAQALAPMPGLVGKMGAATNQATGHSANLFAQWNDIGVMMAAGQNPMQLALQQGTQVSQVLMQLGGGTTALRAVGTSFLAMLNPISLATIGIIAFGAAGVQWLASLGGETKTFDEHLEDLNGTLGRMQTNLDLLANTRLEQTFGSLTGSARGLAEGLVALDRASELKQLQDIVGSALDQKIDGHWLSWDNLAMGIGLGATPMPGMTSEDYLSNTPVREPRYGELGAANTYDDFQSRVDNISELAKSGDVDAVVDKLLELQQAMTGGGAYTDMDEALQSLIRDLAKAGIETAKIEALWNGSARGEAIKAQIDEVVRGYSEQADLAQVTLQYGANSLQVDEARARQTRAALELKLEELGVSRNSAEAARARLALESQITAEADLAAQSRKDDQAELIADLTRQSEMSNAILRFGEHSAEVEAMRVDHAQEVLKARLEEKGWLPVIVAEALKLNQLEMERAQAVKDAAAARSANTQIAQLRSEAEITRAIVAHGSDSLRVKELQIEAERRQLEQSLATLGISEELKDQWRAAWEAARGIASADPFGALASSAQYLRDSQERIDKLRLEQRLLGQTEVIRARILALWEAERDIRRQGVDPASARAVEMRSAAAEEAKLTQELERQRDAWGNVQSSAEQAIDSIVDSLMKGDIPGALEALASEFTGFITDIAVSNPLKNALLGTNLGTLQDVGGFEGIWQRLSGQAEVPGITPPTALDTASMIVTAGSVTVNGGVGFAAGGTIPGAVAGNLNNQPGASGDVISFLKGISTGGATRPDALTGLKQGFASPLSAMIKEAQGIFGEGAVKVFSAYRSPEKQKQLWDAALSKYGSPEAARKWVAPPGSSNHNRGIAADLRYGSGEVQSWMHANAGRYGLDYRMQHEPWHIEPAKGTMADSSGAAAKALGALSTSASTATQDLGTLGTGFDAFGQLLAGMGNGGATGGSGGGGGMFWAVASAIAGDMGIPGFAAGGHHKGGLRIVGENGPELEATGPSTILPADLTRSILTSRPPSINLSAAPSAPQPMSVVVNNFSGQPVAQEEVSDARGGRQLLMTIGQQGAAAMSQPGNPMNKALRQRGLRKGPIPR